TRGAERTGYPTQKPEGVVRRIVAASSAPGDWCLDFFAGSGTLGAVAAALGRRFVLVDDNPEAVEIAAARLGAAAGEAAPVAARRLEARRRGGGPAAARRPHRRRPRGVGGRRLARGRRGAPLPRGPREAPGRDPGGAVRRSGRTASGSSSARAQDRLGPGEV